MAYVKSHSTIPVPEVFFVNHNPNHVVGAAFVLMERMPGAPLNGMWNELSIKHKLAAVSQTGTVVAKLSELKFDRVGSLRCDGTLGPLINPGITGLVFQGSSFTNTGDYFCSFLQDDDTAHPEEATREDPEIRSRVRNFLASDGSGPTLHAPYGLIHHDLNWQNLLFTHDDKSQAPKLTAVIDWDWGATGLLYYLCEYPWWLNDICGIPEEWIENMLLRKQFVSSMLHHFPRHSADREEIRQCFRQKCWRLNQWKMRFMEVRWTDPSFETSLVKGYAKFLKGEHGNMACMLYDVSDWEPDSDPESEDDM